jgi:hypothetical protein
MGSYPQGGALVLVGDDPAAKSSTLPCASDAALADLNIPYLYPADSQDVLDLGRHAIDLSRASGPGRTHPPPGCCTPRWASSSATWSPTGSAWPRSTPASTS